MLIMKKIHRKQFKQIDKNNIIYDELCMFKPPTSE